MLIILRREAAAVAKLHRRLLLQSRKEIPLDRDHLDKSLTTGLAETRWFIT